MSPLATNHRVLLSCYRGAEAFSLKFRALLGSFFIVEIISILNHFEKNYSINILATLNFPVSLIRRSSLAFL